MKHYKNWGTVSSGAELYMLNRAERHRRELEHERKTIQGRLPRVNERHSR